MNVGMDPFYCICPLRAAQPVPSSGMRRLATAVPLALALAPAAAPAQAQAAQVITDRSCYLQTGQQAPTVSLSGNGFGAGRPFSVLLDGQPNGQNGTTDAGGALFAPVVPPLLGAAQHQRAFTIAAQSDDLSAQTTFTVTRFLAGFTPTSGDPAKLRVRFSVYGFNLAAAKSTVYLHYVAPNGRLRRTIRIGQARGACGAIPKTARHKLFPFGSPSRGTWKLQFDTSKRYRRGTSKSSFLFYSVAVRIRKA